jgi:DNA repair protein RadC
MLMGEIPLDASGHRARLRRRLFDGGPEALLDHELVEYLLALALPRRDTKPLAKKLIKDFGSFGALLAADAETIARVGDISEGAVAALKIAAGLRAPASPERSEGAPRASAPGRPCSTICTPNGAQSDRAGPRHCSSIPRTC